MGGFAWVTLATNDSYSLGALVLGHALKQAGTIGQLVVLVTPGVTPSMRANLSAVFNIVQEVNILDSKDESNLRLLKRPELGVTFTKLHCWRLTQFDKCVFLDADTLILSNCDELFEREEFSAAPDVGWPDCFNSGVFVFKPNNSTYESLIKFALDNGSFDGGDQGLLNLFFSDWAHKDINKRLPFIYNMCSMASYSYLPAFRQFGGQVKIVHFIGVMKPWLQYFDTESKQVQPAPGTEHLKQHLQLWWNIFCTQVHPALTTDMCSAAQKNTPDKRPDTSISRTPAPINNPYDSFFTIPAVIPDPWLNYQKTDFDSHKPIESHNTNSHDAEDASEQDYVQSITNEAINNDCTENTDTDDDPVEDFEYKMDEFYTDVPLESTNNPLSEHTPPPSDTDHTISTLLPSSSNANTVEDIPEDKLLPDGNNEEGLANAFAQFTLGSRRSENQSALEDHLRRQSWEVGNIDYLGRDSFSNIWSKISETMAGSAPKTDRKEEQVIARTESAPIAPPMPISAPETTVSTKPDAVQQKNEPVDSTSKQAQQTPAALKLQESHIEGPPVNLKDILRPTQAPAAPETVPICEIPPQSPPVASEVKIPLVCEAKPGHIKIAPICEAKPTPVVCEVKLPEIEAKPAEIKASPVCEAKPPIVEATLGSEIIPDNQISAPACEIKSPVCEAKRVETKATSACETKALPVCEAKPAASPIPIVPAGNIEQPCAIPLGAPLQEATPVCENPVQVCQKPSSPPQTPGQKQASPPQTPEAPIFQKGSLVCQKSAPIAEPSAPVSQKQGAVCEKAPICDKQAPVCEKTSVCEKVDKCVPIPDQKQASPPAPVLPQAPITAPVVQSELTCSTAATTPAPTAIPLGPPAKESKPATPIPVCSKPATPAEQVAETAGKTEDQGKPANPDRPTILAAPTAAAPVEKSEEPKADMPASPPPAQDNGNKNNKNNKKGKQQQPQQQQQPKGEKQADQAKVKNNSNKYVPKDVSIDAAKIEDKSNAPVPLHVAPESTKKEPDVKPTPPSCPEKEEKVQPKPEEVKKESPIPVPAEPVKVGDAPTVSPTPLQDKNKKDKPNKNIQGDKKADKSKDAQKSDNGNNKEDKKGGDKQEKHDSKKDSQQKQEHQQAQNKNGKKGNNQKGENKGKKDSDDKVEKSESKPEQKVESKPEPAAEPKPVTKTEQKAEVKAEEKTEQKEKPQQKVDAKDNGKQGKEAKSEDKKKGGKDQQKHAAPAPLKDKAKDQPAALKQEVAVPTPVAPAPVTAPAAVPTAPVTAQATPVAPSVPTPQTEAPKASGEPTDEKPSSPTQQKQGKKDAAPTPPPRKGNNGGKKGKKK